MTTRGPRRAAFRALSAVFMLLARANASPAEEPIRVLVVMPGGDHSLARQVRLVEDALRRADGQVARANSLADADAVVHFTAYHRVIREGKSQDWYYGHYVLLHAQSGQSFSGSKRFGMIAIESEDWQVEPVLRMLGRTLGAALGLPPAPYERKPEGRRPQGI